MTPPQAPVPQQASATRDPRQPHDSHQPRDSRQHSHPPKVETFDLAAMTNTDPKGFVRGVDEYRVEPFGLYMARPIVDHPNVEYVESWLLPEQGLRISDWWFRPGRERDQDFYLDIAEVTPGERAWRSVDHYLDIVLRIGQRATVLDSDELLAAVLAGHLAADVAEQALHTTYRVIDGLARTGYRLEPWLASVGVSLEWRRHP